MKNKLIATLVAVNAALLMAVGVKSMPSEQAPVHAQFNNNASYTMISGQVRGRNQDGIYLMDTGSGDMVVFVHDGRNGEVIARRNIAEDLQEGATSSIDGR